MIERALAAAVVRDANGALAAALAAWREVPDPRLALAVGELARLAAPRRRGMPPVVLRPAEWDAAAARRDPIELDALVANVVKTSADQAAIRITALAAWPRDPRFGDALARWLEAPPFTSRGSFRFWTAVGAAIATSGDPRVVGAATRAAFAPHIGTEEVRAYVRRIVATALTGLVDALPATTQLDGADRARCDALLAELASWDRVARSREDTEAMFLDRIRADADDDGARLVFADWLLEQQDPRGELIALAFARRDGHETKAGRTREAALLRAHRATWLGGLAKVIDVRAMVFERGFVEAVELTAKRGAEAIARTVADPAWGTVTTIRLGSPSLDLHAAVALLGGPALRNLRALHGVTLDVLDALRARPVAGQLATLGVMATYGDRDAWATALAAGAFPALHHLEWIDAVTPARVGQLLVDRFDSVSLRGISSHTRLRFERESDACWHLEITVPAQLTTLPDLATILREHRGRLANIVVIAEGELAGALRAELDALDVGIDFN